MHETAAIASSVGPTLVILIGILFGILYNQRGTDKLELRLNTRIEGIEARINRLEAHLEARLDRVEARIDRLEAHVDNRLDKIQADLITFHRNLGQHDKALEILEKRAS